MAQCEDLFSVASPDIEDTKSNLNNSEISVNGLSNNDNQINGCSDDPPMEEVIVYGHATYFSWGFIRFWWSLSPGGNGGGSGESISFGEVDANKECQALGRDGRLDLLNAALIALRSKNAGNLMRFLRDHPPHSIFSVTLPNGSVMRGIVSGAFLPLPILAEATNTCE